MNENEFYVAIQGIMTQAHEAGWEIDDVEQKAIDAAEEWLEEMEKSLPSKPIMA
jgi:isoaspartyl peptidase/L-asparaginase-like protein (Ntn-hydrolase superfamily)